MVKRRLQLSKIFTKHKLSLRLVSNRHHVYIRISWKNLPFKLNPNNKLNNNAFASELNKIMHLIFQTFSSNFIQLNDF